VNAREGQRRRATNEPAPGRVGRRLGRRWPLPLAGAAAMAALLFLTPLSSAATVMTFGAPYTGGTLVQYRDPVAQGCGAHLAVSTPATFSLTTGRGTGNVGARSGTCATSDSQASYDGTVGVGGLAFKPGLSGTYTATAHWNITWNASASMNGAAATAGGQASIEIWLLVKIHDATTGKTFVGKTVYLVQKDLATAVKFATGKVGGLYTATISSALTAGDSYQVSATLGYDVEADVPQGSAAGSATTAAVDLGSSGHGGTLTSISLA
jgi:hypothetical protein